MIIKELTIHIYGKLKNMNNKIKGKIKDTKQKILLNIIQSINRYFINLPKDTEKENSHGYEDLMPKIDVEKNKQYCESIEWALKNYEIKNIALTGVYGSGKSTILKTYKSQHNEYKYLNISLASFKDEELEKESNGEIEGVKYSKGDIDNIDIEKAILKQIFYKEKYKTIPYSRFKRINNINEIPIIGKLILILATIFFGALFFNPHLITNIRERLILVKNVLNINKYLFIFLVISFAVIVLTALVKVIKYIKNRVKISIIKTGAGEIEIDNSDKSVFNKYIDEILYFFEVTKYDVVIFEDLDRFNNIEIFSRLRELNLLINNSEQINKRVVFIYALRDDMFSNKDNKDDKICYKNRTKFFDFIIPVLQVTNSSNACDVLFKKFQKFNELV
ncbi:NTPase [Clostridium botulinum]|nr:NTPase [Clostridium botulinum]